MKITLITKFVTYAIAIIMMGISFWMPPTGAIDPSVLFGIGLLVGSYELLFGTSIKSLHIDKTGVHIETYSHS